MSKKHMKTEPKSGRCPWALCAAIVGGVLLLAAAVGLVVHLSTRTPYTAPDVIITDTNTLPLGNGLLITDLGRYAGKFLEDGSDEVVSDVLMIVVKNNGNKTLQYAEIQLNTGVKTASFSLSTLAPGKSMVVLEKNRQKYASGERGISASTDVAVFFSQEPQLHADVLKIQPLDGGFNIANVSGKDITGDILIYYKNSADDLYYGGITYRARIEGGMKAGEIRQALSDHFSADGSEVMFVTYNG